MIPVGTKLNFKLARSSTQGIVGVTLTVNEESYDHRIVRWERERNETPRSVSTPVETISLPRYYRVVSEKTCVHCS